MHAIFFAAPRPLGVHRAHPLRTGFRRSTTRGPATELRFDTGGDHCILKRQ